MNGYRAATNVARRYLQSYCLPLAQNSFTIDCSPEINSYASRRVNFFAAFMFLQVESAKRVGKCIHVPACTCLSKTQRRAGSSIFLAIAKCKSMAPVCIGRCLAALRHLTPGEFFPRSFVPISATFAFFHAPLHTLTRANYHVNRLREEIVELHFLRHLPSLEWNGSRYNVAFYLCPRPVICVGQRYLEPETSPAC